jgi:hypothetical protein
LAKVKVDHHFVYESKRVTRGGVDAEEWDDVGVRKLAGDLHLLEKSLDAPSVTT